MMKQRIIFRADAGKGIGYGHFIRSLALAGYLKDDFDCYFTTFNHSEKEPTEYQLNEIAKVATYLPLKAESTAEFDQAFLEVLTSTDIVVLDNYFFTTEYQKKIKDKGCKLVSIDDMHDRHFVSDLLISFCPDAENKFDMESYTQCLGGFEWVFLRAPFLDTPLRERESGMPHRIVVAMGGADPFGLTDKVISSLLSIDPNLEIHAILGDTAVIHGHFDNKVVTHRRLSADEIVELFDTCDLGIFPSSTTCFEAFSRSLPIAGGWFVDNQKEFYDYTAEKGLFYPLGCLLDDPKELTERFRKVLKESDFAAKCPYDFKANRQLIIETFKFLQSDCYLRPARRADRDILFQWSNDPDVRANSFNSSPIPYADHCRWFEKVMQSDNVRIYFLIDKGQLIGQVRLNIDKGNAEIGYSIAKEHRGKGYGNKIIEKIIDVTEKDGTITHLIAAVKSQNQSSLKIFERNGFNRISNDVENEEKVSFIKKTNSI